MTKRLPVLLLMIVSLMLAGCTVPDEAGTPTPSSPANGGTTPTPATTTTPTPPANGGTNGNGTGTGGNGTGDGSGNGPASGSLLDEGFESGFAGWNSRTDLSGGAGNWTFGASSEEAHDGQGSLRLAFEGGEPRGAGWISRQVQTSAAGGSNNASSGGSTGIALNLSVWIRDASGGSLTGGTGTSLTNGSTERYAILWIGTTEPTAADQFDAENGANAHSGVRIPLREDGGAPGSGVGADDGWQQYTLEWATPAPASGILYVALGVFAEGGTAAEFYLDDLELAYETMS